MKTKCLVAVLLGLATLALCAADASAFYNPSLGCWMQRDPGPGGMVAAPRVGITGPAAGGEVLPRNPTGQYADGLNLYQYVRSNPIRRTDSSGKVSVYIRGGPSPNSFDGDTPNYMTGKFKEADNDEPAKWINNAFPGEAVKFIKDELGKNACQPVIVTGYSWGGYGAAEVTRLLENEKVKGHKITVTFLGTVDVIGKIIFNDFRVGSTVAKGVNYYQHADWIFKGNPLTGGHVANYDWTNRTRANGRHYDHFTIIGDARELVADRAQSIIRHRSEYQYGKRKDGVEMSVVP